ncbi:MAG: hypothetical protein AB1898_32310 [Acidobacteriota bacterium]
MESRNIRCGACRRDLNPNQESIVFLTWGTGLCGNQNPVLALCSTTEHELETGGASPCVAAALKLFRNAQVRPVVASYAGWLDSVQRTPEGQTSVGFLPLLLNQSET